MFSARIHRFIFLFGLCALAFGMMMGTVPTSVPQIILASNWLLSGRFNAKWQKLRKNKLFWILGSFYLIHLIGIIYSQNLGAAADDVRTKLPLLFLPLVLLTEDELKATELRGVLWCFLVGSLINTLWCHTYTFILHNNEVVRNASRFMSHIRLGLYLNLAIAVCLWFAWYERGMSRALLALLALYFVVSIFVLGLASGAANLLLLLLLLLSVVLWRSGWRARIASVAGAAILIAVTGVYLDHIHDSQLEVREGPENMPQRYSYTGVPYVHFDSTGQRENGYFVLINIHLEELKRAWNRDFPADTFNYKPPVNISRFEVLVRYMASKGLIKDSIGYLQLTPQDKEYIKRGYTNFLQPEWSFLRRRAYELVNEYDEFMHGRAINGHSFTMRLYFWNAALHAIAERPVLGAGTGDVQQVMNVAYEKTRSPLNSEWRIRPHNQFLTVTVALGVVGLVIFLVSLLWPVLRLRACLHMLYWPFLVLALVSFLFEDTLETQAGLTFFAFFNSLFLCQAWFRKQQTPADSPVSH